MSDNELNLEVDVSTHPGLFLRGDRHKEGAAKEQEKHLDSSKLQKKKMQDMKEDGKTIFVVGICAMAKKSHSKPMKEILSRLEKFEYIVTDVFDECMILNEPVENWPLCHCLISFFSQGFPLEKAIEYAELRKPFVINDLYQQFGIQDRKHVYSILKRESIGLPRYAILDRDSTNPADCHFVEADDYVEINGEVFHKPFVEKPVSAEDHNVYIYYPSTAGGGSQRLFRKIGSRSSVYSPESRVRKQGSYIYEEFMPTDGTDVKVYTVGPDYAHAEARKSPALDGKVERDSEGKEVRYPVILNNIEKLIARKVCQAFKQTVCGFDLLRANGRYYVCDVNGFSFVKNSKKYYDDCAKILGHLIMRELAPQYNIPWNIPIEEEEVPYVPTTSGSVMELRSVIGIMRHGDRTPKQKTKMEIKHRKFFELFEKYGGFKHGKIKLKKPSELQEVLDVTRFLLSESENSRSENEIEEKRAKLEQVKNVLEMHGKFSGINRKVQLKYQPRGRPGHASSDDDTKEEPSLLLIVKWGGELTVAGKLQAEELGRAFRLIYPAGQGEFEGFPGCGLLRLHSTYRHDLKIYASDEGRVKMTAAAFTKGMLALEGALTPILVQMVKSSHGLLDFDKDSLSMQARVKQRLYGLMKKDRNFTEADIEKLAPTKAQALLGSIEIIKNPVTKCERVYELMKYWIKQMKDKLRDPSMRGTILHHHETLDMMIRRWSKLEKDFKKKSGRFDITKIPDIYDCITYDCLHNQVLKLEKADELLACSHHLANIIIPQEYGMTKEEKLALGKGICLPLLTKLRKDLQRVHAEDENVNRLNPKYSDNVESPDRHVQTRLYFTSESHIHSLVNFLRLGGLCDENDEQWNRALAYLDAVKELNYMTQIIIMLYEDPEKDPASEERFHVELHFSPGIKSLCEVVDSHNSEAGYDPDITHTSHEDLPSGSLSGNKSQTSEQLPGRLSLDGDIFTHNSPYRRRKCFSLTNTNDFEHSHPLTLHGAKLPLYSSSMAGVDSQVIESAILPLETLHNSLSLKQVEDFLDAMTAEDCTVSS
ncbi:inositol hexakisphosphate and diphosphoinositol-pentakisphosphate kinase 2-like [Ptychodera flava]|uniref:inositol hexakisphosphate and diphosphoinositol-pentakisphosphate kinase 2-like n=1 Tax=Ptychodera flava TaxID=63121 RepID=UPI00396AAE35